MKCKTYQAVGRSPSQDIASLKHLDHEGAAVPEEIVLGTYPREDTVYDPDLC